ncbi:anti-sigma factor family protein [Archangium lansingense]|uniref:Zf-HC2 domain-containing protein n=1 Tax=Archangium lansingense TaxID=2995310 RepID=A0ABT4A3E1_9BACT|nr:zf-HC2 domain-containing protein [Archangium lansinium]MCY1076168.1 zf-HC2 domain-containing protein [Archangium lansinium]
MAACQDQDELLTLFAAGALEPEEAARVRAHLDTCAACRSEAEANHDVLGLAALPQPSVREQAVVAALPQTTVSAWRREQVQKAARMRTAGALMAAAAVVLLVMGPVVQHRTVTPPLPTAQVESTSSEEDTLALEQWALADPLTEALDLSEVDLEEAESDESLDSELDDFFTYPNPGDSL